MVSSRPSVTSHGWELPPPPRGGSKGKASPPLWGGGARRAGSCLPQASGIRVQTQGLPVCPSSEHPSLGRSEYVFGAESPPWLRTSRALSGMLWFSGGLGPALRPALVSSTSSEMGGGLRGGMCVQWGEVGGCGVGSKTNFISFFFFLRQTLG